MTRRSSFTCSSIRVFGVLGLALCALACGGKTVDTGGTPDSGVYDSYTPPLDGPGYDTQPPPFDAPKTDGIVDDVGPSPDVPTPVDGPLPDAPPPDPSVCDDLAAAICTPAAESCCTSHGARYDATKCTSAEKAYCSDQITLVKSGKMTYDASQLSACKDAWKATLAKCSLFFVDWVKAYAPCGQLWNGTVAPGGACTYDYQCKAPVGGSVGCNPTSHKCNAYVIVGAGAGCNFSGATVHYCDMGYYCDVTSTTPTCQPQKAIGATCDAPDDLSCGYSNVCKSGKCAAGAAGGTACTSHYDCASWYCDPSTSKCSDPNVELGDPKSGICIP